MQVRAVRSSAPRGAVPPEGSVFKKRIVCAALALALLGSTAASAHERDHGGYGRGFRHHHHGGEGLALGLGLGILALGVIAAQSARDHDRYRVENGYYDDDRYRDDYRDRNRYYDSDRDDYDDGYRGDDDY